MVSMVSMAPIIPAPGVPPTVLKHGDQGPGVLEVQLSLKRLGYLKWSPDGFWGEGTEKEPMQRWPCKDTYILYIVSLHDSRRKSHSQPYSHKGLRVYHGLSFESQKPPFFYSQMTIPGFYRGSKW